MRPIISKHAKKRLKQRLGLKRKSHIRHIQKVLEKGILQYRDIEENILYIWYDYRRYIFEDLNGLEAILITVFPKEKNYHNPINPI
jgi:hypothetical protein